MYIDDNNNADTNIGAILDPLRYGTVFEPMTSAIPVQRSTNWANKPTMTSKLASKCMNVSLVLFAFWLLCSV